MADPEKQPVQSTDEDPTSRFRRLTSEDPKNNSETLDGDSSQDPVEDVQDLSPDREPVEETEQGPTVSEHMVRELREKGYILDEDAHGVRITGSPSLSDNSNLSPYDIVRMAADLEGGVISREQLTKCPKCEAALQVGADTCQWCGEKVE